MRTPDPPELKTLLGGGVPDHPLPDPQKLFVGGCARMGLFKNREGFKLVQNVTEKRFPKNSVSHPPPSWDLMMLNLILIWQPNYQPGGQHL